MNVSDIFENMKMHGIKSPDEKVYINLSHLNNGNGSESVVRDLCSQYVGANFIWLKEYDEIVDWLNDNQGRGLFLYGDCGRGKTVFGSVIIPAILLTFCRKVVTVYNIQQINTNLDDVLTKKIISVDDIGTEDISVKYGEKRWSFPEIIDNAEKRSNLVVITTNLSAKEIEQRYGVRVLDRIKSVTKRVLFKGDSFRK